MKSRLVIAGEDVGFKSILPISINMSVADIREPGKSNSHYSKTIKIPGTGQVNRIFEWAFETNIESDSFNANLKTDAAYYVNEVKVYDGKLQLLRVNKYHDGITWQVEYECSIVGETGNIFLEIAPLFLTDIDFSDLDHSFTYASGLFNPTLGSGYCYPYIDYGVNPFGSRVGYFWTFEHLKPAIFEKEYIDRIFENAGYTYTSNYLTSTYAKSIIIPCVSEGALQLPNATIVNNQFAANCGGVGSPVTGTLASTGVAGGVWSYQNLTQDPVPYDTEAFDPGGVYDATTYIFEPSISGTFSITATVDITFTINAPATTATLSGSYDIALIVYGSDDAGSTWTLLNQHTFNVAPSGGLPATSNPKMQVDVPPRLYTQPYIFKVVLSASSFQFAFLDGSSASVVAGTSSIDYSYDGVFGALVASANLPTGQTVVMNDTIPVDVKQLDFLTSIIKMENLYIEVDKANPNNYIIEPREDFITTTAVDWTSKLDTSKPVTVMPMGELDAKRYIFTYQSDEDFYNKLYYDEFKEVYGTETVDINSDFVRGEKKIEVIFAATPSASSSDVNNTNIVAPRFFRGELDAVQPMRCKIRRLYWGGLIPCSSHGLITSGYEIVGGAGGYSGPSPITKIEYPYAGHVDDPMDPTIDLCWDNPLRLYWNYPSQTYTDNQRYNERYSKFIYEISHRDSKIVTAYLFLNEKDISEFSFRKKVFIENAYYFVNEIKDYDPQESKSIPVELLKLNEGPDFVATHAQNMNDILGGSSGTFNNNRMGSNYNSAGNYGSGKSFGTNNTNNSPYTLVIGSNNYVG